MLIADLEDPAEGHAFCDVEDPANGGAALRGSVTPIDSSDIVIG